MKRANFPGRKNERRKVAIAAMQKRLKSMGENPTLKNLAERTQSVLDKTIKNLEH